MCIRDSDKIEKITGKRPTLFRPPFGEYDDHVITTVRGMGIEPIQWDVDSLDWKDYDAATITQRVTSSVGPDVYKRQVLDNRNRLTVSGVDGVESFDETSIVMSTAEGSLIIRGESLHIEKLSLDGGDLLVEGTVDSLTYEEEEPRQGSFLGRLFRG